MPSIIIRDLSDKTKRALKTRALHHERSMEEEARQILNTALKRYMQAEAPLTFFERTRALVQKHGGLVDTLAIPARQAWRSLPTFS